MLKQIAATYASYLLLLRREQVVWALQILGFARSPAFYGVDGGGESGVASEVSDLQTAFNALLQPTRLCTQSPYMRLVPA